MLSERRSRLVYEAKADEARLVVEGAGSPSGKPRPAEAMLLLDTSGALVGVDLGGEGLARTVVMVGAHEDVADTRAVTVTISRDARGDPCELRIAKAKATLRL